LTASCEPKWIGLFCKIGLSSEGNSHPSTFATADLKTLMPSPRATGFKGKEGET
jgi:hypothetical protein